MRPRSATGGFCTGTPKTADMYSVSGALGANLASRIGHPGTGGGGVEKPKMQNGKWETMENGKWEKGKTSKMENKVAPAPLPGSPPGFASGGARAEWRRF